MRSKKKRERKGRKKRKAKRLPFYIGSKIEMLSKKKSILKIHPRAKITLVAVKYPKGVTVLKVSRRVYRILTKEEEQRADWR